VRVVESNHPALDPVARLVLGKLGARADRERLAQVRAAAAAAMVAAAGAGAADRKEAGDDGKE
jgi:hypothetical protein